MIYMVGGVAFGYRKSAKSRLRCKTLRRLILQRGKIGLDVPEERFVMPDVPIDERHKAYRLNEKEEMLPLEDGPRR